MLLMHWADEITRRTATEYIALRSEALMHIWAETKNGCLKNANMYNYRSRQRVRITRQANRCRRRVHICWRTLAMI